MLLFSHLFLVVAFTLFSLASASSPISVTFSLHCRDGLLKDPKATVELWEYNYLSQHKYVTRLSGDVLADGKTKYTITGNANNWWFQWDNYFLKIVHSCSENCPKSVMSYVAVSQNMGELPIALSASNNYKDLYNRCV